MAGRVGYVTADPLDVDYGPPYAESEEELGYTVNPSEELLETMHERDAEGRCLTCLRFGEKQDLIRRAVATNDKTERDILLERARTL